MTTPRLCVCGCGRELPGGPRMRRHPICRKAMHVAARKRWTEANKHKPEVIAKQRAHSAAMWAREPEKMRLQMRLGAARRHRARKMAAIAAYGGKCGCCGEDRWQFLTLQHTRGDGAAHRRELVGHLKNPRLAGVMFLRRLQEQGFPKDRGIELRCANCHMAEDMFGGCPHKPLPPPPSPLEVELALRTQARIAALISVIRNPSNEA